MFWRITILHESFQNIEYKMLSYQNVPFYWHLIFKQFFLFPDMLGDTPLDMLQYYLLFGVHRFPESPKDRLTYNTDSKHIVVAHNNNFFKVSPQ